MGKVACVSYSLQGGRAVFLRRIRGGFVFEKAVDEKPNPEVLKNCEPFLSLFYPDLISEKVESPPVDDPETLEALLKKKITQITGATTEYMICYEEIGDESGEEQKVYRVFAVPSEVYSGDEFVNSLGREKVSIFTVSQFSPSGISRFVDPDKVIFHIYMDLEKLIMTVSEGENILYSRSLAVPSYVSETGNYSDFLLENTNMTYVYVAQRQGIKVDLILVSGKAKDEEVFVKNLLELTSKGIASPLPPPQVKNLSVHTFHYYLPALGTLFLSEAHDFSPLEVKERRRFVVMSSRVSIVAGFFSVALLILLLLKIFSVLGETREIRSLKDQVNRELVRLIKDPVVAGGEYSYYYNYLNKLYAVRKGNPLNILPESAELIKSVKATKYALAEQGGRIKLAIEIDRYFKNIVDMNVFAEELKAKLSSIEKRGIKVNVGNVVKDLKKFNLKMTVVLEKPI